MQWFPTLGPVATRFAGFLASRIERYPRGGPMVLAALVGLLTGLAAVGFGALVDLAHWLFFDVIDERLLGGWPRWRLVLIPAAGGLLAATITTRFAREARGQGVSDVMYAMETAGGRIRTRVAPAMALATALTIGSGGSAGKQGPVVQIGAGLASTVAQWLRLSSENVRLLAACGVAGGVAAAFNAPIAGVFFALEVVLRSINTRNFSVVMIAALVATAVSTGILGSDPVIDLPQYRLEHAAVEIPLYALLGVIAAGGGVAFIALTYRAEDRFLALPLHSPLLVPAVGGAIVGALALIDGGVLGVGDEVLDDVLHERTATDALMLLLLLKTLATASTIGSGGSGGVFSPSLFLGALTGGAFGAVAHRALPALTATAGAYATVGMAAMFAAVSHAPISAVLMLFELTRDYGIMLPLMTAVATATVVSQLVGRGSVYTVGLQRRGLVVEEEPGPVSVMGALRVADAMSPAAFTVAPDTPASQLMLALRSDPEAVTLVVDDRDALVGVVTHVDLTEALAAEQADPPARDLCPADPRAVFPDQTLHQALGIFADRGVHALPVVQRDAPLSVVGVLRRSDVTRAYSAATEQRVALARRRQLASLTSDDVRYLDLTVTVESGLDGLELSELDLTEDAVVVAVRHDGVTAIPRGHTRLAAGDRVTVIAAGAVVAEVRAIFEGAPPRR